MKTYSTTRFGLLLIAPFLYLLSATASAASFNCGKASTLVERMICLDYRLSDMDIQLADLYQAKQWEAGIKKSELVTSQRQWLATRNRCKTFACLRETHINRISALNFKAGQKYKDKANSNTALPWDLRPPEGYATRKWFFQANNSMYAELWPIEKYRNLKLFDKRRPSGWMDLTGRVGFDAFEFKSERPELSSQSLALALGDFYVRDGSDYHACGSSVDTTGLLVADMPFGRNEDSGSRHLIVIRKQRWTFLDPPRCNDEIGLSYKPLAFWFASIWSDSLYLSEEDFVIRFDRDLWTGSALIGSKVFAVWWSDLEPMLGKTCQYSDKACIDKRLEILLGDSIK